MELEIELRLMEDIKRDFGWFFKAIEYSTKNHKWVCERDGALRILSKKDEVEVSMGQICIESNGHAPEFGILGMAAFRSLGSYNNHTKTSKKLRAIIKDITNYEENNHHIRNHTP